MTGGLREKALKTRQGFVGRIYDHMTDERTRRLSIGEKRARAGLLSLGPEYLEVEYREIRSLPEPDETIDWAEVVVPDATCKKPISLRVDPDVLEFFKNAGPGYQTRMNAVLRAYMEAKLKRS